jgi:acyl carrier protein
MDTTQVRQTLRDYIVEHYKIQPDDADFTDDVHLFDYGYIDSFGAVDLVSFVEVTFGITVTQSDLTAYPLNTINEIATFVSLRQHGEL